MINFLLQILLKQWVGWVSLSGSHFLKIPKLAQKVYFWNSLRSQYAGDIYYFNKARKFPRGDCCAHFQSLLTHVVSKIIKSSCSLEFFGLSIKLYRFTTDSGKLLNHSQQKGFAEENQIFSTASLSCCGLNELEWVDFNKIS